MNGRSVKAYADQIARPQRSVEREVCSARVVCAVVEQVPSVTRTYSSRTFSKLANLANLPRSMPRRNPAGRGSGNDCSTKN